RVHRPLLSFPTRRSSDLTLLVHYSRDGSLHYVCMDWRHIRELLDAAQPVYSELKNLCVWAKDNAGMGSLYRSQHELVFVFKRGRSEEHTSELQSRFDLVC